ncbi:aspartyl protease family protein 2-like [Impatiens glandulifera]|uniref:aspartyl protease family protein 2-like n=1 Tax=Impatiens glandulifera TaxID=253017 RepID=UPI001FB15806|nr:aspartyl protease family protein 2-like [Impatiens glandulifera]
MISRFLGYLVLLLFLFAAMESAGGTYTQKSNISHLAGIEFPDHMSFSGASVSDCGLAESNPEKSESNPDGIKQAPSVKLQLNHRRRNPDMNPKDSVFESTSRDLVRIQTLHKRIVEKKNQNSSSRQKKYNSPPSPSSSPDSSKSEFSGQLMATLESGVSLGSGEYFMDVFVGTPPKHFSLILDTGSDLNWIQSVPCHDCFEQNGPHYNPNESSSFKNISCHDPRCRLVSSPDPVQPCKTENQTCPYYYWYGDSSNTTGDFALETFTVNLTNPAGESKSTQVKNVMFGSGHWNRGLFHGAGGLLGLGRGPLSFSSQLQSLYGHSFSYCLVDRNSNSSVTSKLIFGEDKDILKHPQLNYTKFVGGNENPVETFYYVEIKSINVGGETLNIPEKTWVLSADGGGGTIVDSGTTLSYFADPAYRIIKDAFIKKTKGGYPLVNDFPILDPCFNVSGVKELDLPSFAINFSDGAVWNFPVENYFVKLEPEEVVCLAILGTTTHSSMSIIGNYQQQNFHVLYDTKNSRLGFAPTRCADV